MDIVEQTIQRICDMIGEISFAGKDSVKPYTLEGQCVQDADRLDAMGAIGIARTFAYGGAKGRPLGESLAHFEEKLLLLYDLLSTPEARELAKPRLALLQEFYHQYKEETK